jgi:hypothetical protein
MAKHGSEVVEHHHQHHVGHGSHHAFHEELHSELRKLALKKPDDEGKTAVHAKDHKAEADKPATKDHKQDGDGKPVVVSNDRKLEGDGKAVVASADHPAPEGKQDKVAPNAKPSDGKTFERTSLEITNAYDGHVNVAPDVPAPVKEAIASGAPIRFSATKENQEAHRQPDFYFTPEGKLVANSSAKPSTDGSINIEIQNRDKSSSNLSDAITNQTEEQKQAAKVMGQLYEKAHPGEPAPKWLADLSNAKPVLADFVPFNPPPSAPSEAPPENGFVSRGVSHHHRHRHSDGGFSSFAGNGGFDNHGNFRGNGGSGDGFLSTGVGKPLGPGEQVTAKDIYDYLVNVYGLTPIQASGILGNMQTESSFRTNALNKGEGAIGLAQWEGGRRTQLEAFAAGQGKPVTDWHVQVDFMMKELKGPERGAWNALQAARSPSEAAHAFDKFYERSAGTSRGERMANASNIFNVLT